MNAYLPPEDTGEALGLGSSRLTLTFGFGPALLEQEGGEDRFGLRTSMPKALADIPPMPGEEMEPERSGGDLCVQACAEDKQVAFHAIRNLTRISRGVATGLHSDLLQVSCGLQVVERVSHGQVALHFYVFLEIGEVLAEPVGDPG